MISLVNLSVSIRQKLILREIDLEISTGQWTCLVGPNGAGKTTLLRVLLGTCKHTGSATEDGRELYNNYQRNIAFVPQHPQIPKAMSVAEYVMLGRAKRDGWGNESAASRRFVTQILHDTSLHAARNQLVGELSGGEMQRAIIARALAQEPATILLDEPTSALDLHYQVALLSTLEILKERGVTIISTMHDITLAAMYADDIVIMKEGVVTLAQESAHAIYSDELRAAFDNQLSIQTVESGQPVILATKQVPVERIAQNQERREEQP